MKRFKKMVIGGIESKLVTLIIAAVLLVSVVFVAVMLTQTRMLTQLTEDTTGRQLASMTGTTEAVIDTVIESSMDRSTDLEAQLMDQMFRELAVRVQMVGDYAKKLLDDPDSFPRLPWYWADASKDGELYVKALLAVGVEEADVADRLGLIANMSDMMCSLCAAYGADNIWFTLAEGATLMADTVPSQWIREDGSYENYDAMNRYWYRQAAAAGKLVFSDVEIDRRTGEMCVTCALPVYTDDGVLRGVAGADLYLTEMQQAAAEAVEKGGYLVAVNHSGHVVISPEEESAFRVLNSARAEDLRQSENAELAALVTDALQGKTDVRLVSLEDGEYYMIGVPMKTVGWALIAAYSEADAEEPIRVLQTNYQTIQQEAASTYRSESSRGRMTLRLLVIVLLAVMFVGAMYSGKRIVKPLNTITRRIAELDEDNLEFRMEDTYRTGDEVEVLAQSFASLSHKTVEYIEQVRLVTAEKERIGTELALATRIQADMLPNIFPAFPDRAEFDIYAVMDPAKEVGGDFYDYFLVDEDHLCMVIADVSGKGVPAALFMMVSKIILANNAMMGKSPARILTDTNAAICTNNREEMFVTVWLGILEISTGILTAANAGHEYPMLKKADGSFAVVKDAHGFVIGGMDGVKYKEYCMRLEPGDKLFFYTDGVPEATDADKELFGTERLLDALNRDPASSPERLLKNVRAAVDGFVGDAEQFDDLTMMCMQYFGGGKGDKA